MSKKRSWGRWTTTGDQPMEGGQGRVFVVVDSTGELCGDYVLKELKNPKRIQRFLREINAIRGLPPHENVVSLVETPDPRDPSKPAYVMPKGENTLADVVAGLSLESAVSLFELICHGVSHCHANGIVHRDLKPENILMFDGVPKISDFGLSLIDEPQRLTETEEAVGPRFYMAPELEDGKNLNVNATADVYSLGKILYFLLSGGRIFAREKHRSREYALDAEPSDPRIPLLSGVVNRALSLKPESRPKDASELLAIFTEARRRFAAHPLTGLLERFGTMDAILGQPLELLETLDAQQVATVLAVSTAPVSSRRTLLEAARVHLSNKEVGELFVARLVEWEPTLDGNFCVRCASDAIVGRGAHHWFLGRAHERRLIELVSGADDVQTIALAAKQVGWGVASSVGVLPQIARSFGTLDPALAREFLVFTWNLRFEGKEEFLLTLIRGELTGDETALEASVAGLCHCATAAAVEVVAGLAARAEGDALSAVLRGAALGTSHNPEVAQQLLEATDNPVLKAGMSLVIEANSSAGADDDE